MRNRFCKKLVVFKMMLLMTSPVMANKEHQEAITSIANKSNELEVRAQGQEKLLESANTAPNFSSYQTGGKTEAERAIYQDLSAIEADFNAHLNSYQPQQLHDPIADRMKTKQANILANSKTPDVNEVQGLTGKHPETGKRYVNLSPDDELFEKANALDETLIDEASGLITVPALDFKQGDEREIKEVTCIEAGQVAHRNQTLTLDIQVKQSGPVKETLTAYIQADNIFHFAGYALDLKKGTVSQCDASLPDLATVLAGAAKRPAVVSGHIENPIGERVPTNVTYLGFKPWDISGADNRNIFGFDGTTHFITDSSSVGTPNVGDRKLVGNPTYSFIERQGLRIPASDNQHQGRFFFLSANYRGSQRVGMKQQWEVTYPPVSVFESESWVASNPILDQWSDAGVCELMGEECSQGPETRLINGAAITRECWERTLFYECGGGSGANQCQALEDSGCNQIASRCINRTNPGDFCVEFEQTFECQGTRFKNHSGLTLNGTSVSFSTEGSEVVREAYGTEDFAQAAAHLNMLNEIKVPADRDGLIFQGEPKRCDIRLGQDCCNFKGALKDLWAGGCDKAHTEEMVSAVVKKQRCHLVEARRCVSRYPKPHRGCRKRQDTYCCFKSKLARIFQEIAHAQLNVSWGDGENPNCGPLDPRDFSQLNFDTPLAQSLLAEVVAEAFANADNHGNAAQSHLVAKMNLTENVKGLQARMQHQLGKVQNTKPNQRPEVRL